MKEWSIRALLLAVLIAIGFWGWQVFFPSPEKVIRKRLDALARAASFSSNQGLVAKAWNATVLGEFFTTDVQVTVDIPGTQHTISGRDELLQAAVATRSAVSSLTVEFPDIKVTVAPDKDSAVVNLNAQGKVAGHPEAYLQELRLRLIRIKRDWFINQIETVKTLSQRPVRGHWVLTPALCHVGRPHPCALAALRPVVARPSFPSLPSAEAQGETGRTELSFQPAASAAASRVSHLVSRGRLSSRPA